MTTLIFPREGDGDEPRRGARLSSIELNWGNLPHSRQFEVLTRVRSLLRNDSPPGSSLTEYLADLAKSDSDKELFATELERLVLLFYVGEVVKVDFLTTQGINSMVMDEGLYPSGKSPTWSRDEITGYLSEMGFGEFININDEEQED